MQKLQNLPPGKCLKVEWGDVQRMLANFQTFYPAMANFDIQPNVATPAVRTHLDATYFQGPEGVGCRVCGASVEFEV